VNFLNLFNDDPADTGVAGVDIYKMDAEGKAIEHWDTLHLVGDPNNSVFATEKGDHQPLQFAGGPNIKNWTLPRLLKIRPLLLS
jgi:hypothetical protein